MDIGDLTLNQIKEISKMVSNENSCGLNAMIGQKVIVRTYSAGVWFGLLSEKSGSEVILKSARRMWRWHAAESISLSAVALHGINQDKSKIVEAVPMQWLEAIEITPCSEVAVKSLEGAENVEAG